MLYYCYCFLMSFCQKHVNHHCMHAHNCTIPAHRKCQKEASLGKKNDQIPQILCRSSKQLKKIIEQVNEQSQCNFKSTLQIGGSSRKCPSCSRSVKQLQQKNKELYQVRKQHQQISNKYTKMCDQNRQLHGVIEYYREQLDRIIKCGEIDMKNEIKRHLKQNTELSGRNKFLLNKLGELEELVPKLTTTIEQLEEKCNVLRREKHELAVSFNTLLQKIKKFQNNDSMKDTEKEAERKKYNQVESRYQIIIEQTNRNVQSLTKQNKKLYNANKELTQQIEVLRQKLLNAQKMSKMQQQSASEKEIVLKKKIEYCSKEIKDMRETIQKLEQALKLKEEELLFSKKVVEKQLRIIKQNKQIFEQVKHDLDSHDKESRYKQDEDKQNHHSDRNGKSQQQYITQLKSQIKTLKQKIASLQGKSGDHHHSIQNIEHYIMTIGASQAFRRIIQEKNAYIKKLIREKGALMQKMP